MSSDERKACIVGAACKLFAEKGFRGTTTRELAAAVGVTEPVLYEHFKTKRELYSAIIESKAQEGLAFLTELEEAYRDVNDDRGFFNALGNRIVEWYEKDPTFIRLLLFSSLEGHELKDLLHTRTTTCFSIVTDYVRRRMEQGAMRQVDPAIASRTFFGSVAHYALSGLVFGFAPFARSSKEVVAAMVDIFLSGMSTEESK